MIRTLKMVLCLLIALWIAFGATKPTSAEAPLVPKIPTVQEAIINYATQYGISPDKLLAIAKCESNFNMNPKGSNDSGKAHGIYQFHQETWNRYSKDLGEELDINSYQDQAKLAAWAFAHDKQSAWTCAKLTHYSK